MCECTKKIARFILFAINITVWICGAVVMGVGIALAVDEDAWKWFEEISDGMDDALFAAAVYLMISIGALLFLVGFFGCCGVLKNNKCMLQTYIIIISILLALEVTGAILAVVFKDSLEEGVKDDMYTDVQENYGGINSTEGLDIAWNSMQRKLDCCGSYNYTDYNGSAWWLSQPVSNRDPVPITCCKGVKEVSSGYFTISAPDKTTCMTEANRGDFTTTNQLALQGCYDGLWDWMASKSDIILGVLIGLGCLQLFGLIGACCIKGRLDDED